MTWNDHVSTVEPSSNPPIFRCSKLPLVDDYIHILSNIKGFWQLLAFLGGFHTWNRDCPAVNCYRSHRYGYCQILLALFLIFPWRNHGSSSPRVCPKIEYPLICVSSFSQYIYIYIYKHVLLGGILNFQSQPFRSYCWSCFPWSVQLTIPGTLPVRMLLLWFPWHSGLHTLSSAS